MTTPTPLDAVQAGPGDVTSPSPVDTSASSLAGPQPDASEMQQLPQNDGQPMESNPPAEAQPPQPQKPTMWKNILRGALAGLELGGGIGAAEGALDPNTAIQAKQNKQNIEQQKSYFASLQSAHEYLNNSIMQHQMAQWPESLQLSKAKTDTPVVAAREKNGWRPVAFGQGVGDQAMMAVTQQLKQLYPKGIPAGMQFLWSSGGVAAYDPAQANAGAQMDDINTKRAAMGLGPVSFSDLKQDKGGTITKPVNSYSPSPLVKGNTAVARYNSAKSLIAQYQGFDALNQSLPDGSEKKAAGHQLNVGAIAHLQAQQEQARQDIDKENQMKADLAEKAAQARGKAYGMWRTKDVVDPQTGQAKTVWAYQAVGSGAAPLNEGAKLMAKGSQLEDIAQGSANMRADVAQLQNPFTPAQIAFAAAALRETPATAIKQIGDALQTQQISPDQAQFVTDLLNLHERAMSLRSVAGIGQQGSDVMRQAVMAMLPQLKDTPDLMNRKLDRFDQQVAILRRGIPTVKSPGSPQQPKNNAGPQTHVFSVSAWLRANPKGNAAAARAAAEKAGYKVTP